MFCSIACFPRISKITQSELPVSFHLHNAFNLAGTHARYVRTHVTGVQGHRQGSGQLCPHMVLLVTTLAVLSVWLRGVYTIPFLKCCCISASALVSCSESCVYVLVVVAGKNSALSDHENSACTRIRSLERKCSVITRQVIISWLR